MSSMERFEIDLTGGKVRGALHLPDEATAEHPAPAVLLCRGLHVEGDDAAGLFDDLAASLNDAGVAMARFEHRCADLILEDFDIHNLTHELEDAQAVHRWLSVNRRIDRRHIGVIGYALGAIAATTGLARRIENLDRLCLIAPTTAVHLRDRLTRSNGSPAAIDPQRLPKAYMSSLVEIDSLRDVIFHNHPTLIVHGAADRFISPEVSLEFASALELAGRSVEHVLAVRADHAFTGPDARAACLQRVARFFGVMAQQPALAGQA